ncbi:XAC2610-related protein [Xanthocytophaga agilis]|uniref:Uncharacterized protein n=1 Tax=Xanthocytophaga agilis TaxID=3048010 RepID=A0AAE3R682_9BACT|nr:hypothetical protein [Xanthocytophaga agilis]MDJ1504396.1 hypothetical protein [Xanthocytophaga agilis]
MKRYIIPYLILLFWTSVLLTAQVPKAGIYEIKPSYPFPYPIPQYSGESYHTNKRAEPYLDEKLQITYAMVSVDTSAKTIKFLFLAKNPEPYNGTVYGYTPKLEAHAGQYQTAMDTTVWGGDLNSGYDFRSIQMYAGYYFRIYPDQFFLAGTPKVLTDSLHMDKTVFPVITTRYQTVIYPISPFYLGNARPYIDIQKINVDSISLYQNPDVASRKMNSIYGGEYVAVLQEATNWYEVEQVSVNARITHGWLSKEELQSGSWIKQQQHTDEYAFDVAWSDTTEGDLESAVAQAIRIKSVETGATLQVIDRLGATPTNPVNNCIQVQDCNFDGYPDIHIMMFLPAGPNIPHNIYLYNPKTKLFEFDLALSEITSPEFDTKTKTIHSSWRGSCCDHGRDTYQYINGKLILVARYQEDCTHTKEDGTEYCYIIDGKLIKGKWIEKKKKKLLSEVYTEEKK